MKAHRRHRRAGITLFEVVVALVIFTLTLPALAALVQVGVRRAEESAFLAKASMECRSKLAEVSVGAEPLDPTDWTALSEPNWFWKLDVSSGAVDGLYDVQVSVKYDSGSGVVLANLSQIVIDPAYRGSTQDRGILASLENSGPATPAASGTGGSP